MPIIQVNVCNKNSFDSDSQNKEDNKSFLKYFSCIIKMFYVKIRIKPTPTKSENHKSYYQDSIKSLQREDMILDDYRNQSRKIGIRTPIKNFNNTSSKNGNNCQIQNRELVSIVPEHIDKKSHSLEEQPHVYYQKRIKERVLKESLVFIIDQDAEFIENITRSILKAKMDIDECTFLESRHLYNLYILPYLQKLGSHYC
jgi:hypothetical protein